MTTWTQLQADVPAWVNRSDMASEMSRFTRLFEAKAGRQLRTRRQEASFSGTISGANKLALPSDWAGFKTLWLSGQEQSPFVAQSLESVVAKNRTSGAPTMYAIDGSSVRFDGSGDVVGVYYQTLPSIETAGSNWLSVAAYDAYLCGVVAEAWLYLLDENRASLMAAKSQNALDSLMSADQRDKFNGPLVARKR